MFRFRSVVAQLPMRVLAGWLVASMAGWLCLALLGLGIERAVFAAPLTTGMVVAVIGGVEGTALLLALAIFALLVAMAGREHTPAPIRTRPLSAMWPTPPSTGRPQVRAAGAPSGPPISALH
jgi:hypothetical protein